MAYLEDVEIGAVVTIGYVNSETKFKQTFVDWYEKNGWRLKEFHRGTKTSRITITKLFPTEVGKNNGVNEVLKLVSQINREQGAADLLEAQQEKIRQLESQQK